VLIDPKDNLCKVCKVGNCKICETQYSCKECLPNFFKIYYVSNQGYMCNEKIVIDPKLVEVYNPSVFNLEFSEEWPGFFQNFSTSVNLSIGGLGSGKFSWSYERLSLTSFQFIIIYHTFVADGSNLTFTFSPNEDGEVNLKYVLLKKQVSLALEEFAPCAENKTWSKGRK
jgi:hypothetical protein